MKRFIKSFRYGEKGFTLIELLVVIAILGILAAIVVPNFTALLGKGHNEAACIELRMVQTAAVASAAENSGEFPSDGALDVSDTSGLAPYFIGDVLGTYNIAGGEVTQLTYDGGAECNAETTP